MLRPILSILLVAVLAGCVSTLHRQNPVLAKHFIEHGFDGRDWKVGYQAGNYQGLISEWVVNGETVNNWSELLTADIQYRDVSVNELTLIMQEMLAKDCQSFNTETISEDESSILWVWSHDGCQGYTGQHEIRKIMKGTDGIYSLVYAIKSASYSERNYNAWLKIIGEAKLRMIQ